MLADFLAKAAVTVIPSNPQSDGVDSDIVFQDITPQGIGSSSLYVYNLINILSVYGVALEHSCICTVIDRGRSCGECTPVICLVSGSLFKATI
jgi:uncharacterized protein YqgV (UPF0045/DUF77 family)